MNQKYSQACLKAYSSVVALIAAGVERSKDDRGEVSSTLVLAAGLVAAAVAAVALLNTLFADLVADIRTKAGI